MATGRFDRSPIAAAWRAGGLMLGCVLGSTIVAGPAAAIAGSVAPAFSVEIAFSPKAAQLMQRTGEAVGVSADFYQEPLRAGAASGRLTDGFVHVGQLERTVRFSDPVAVTVSGARLDRGAMKAGKPPLMVLVNVVSARRASADNVLSCEAFQDRVVVAARRPVRVACKLVQE